MDSYFVPTETSTASAPQKKPSEQRQAPPESPLSRQPTRHDAFATLTTTRACSEGRWIYPESQGQRLRFMNAHALLTSQGWRGKGHSLHKTNDAIGLSKPLLLSRKDDTKGLGTKKHFTSDLWWMDAFDEQLKGLDTSRDGKVLQTVTTGKLNSIEKAPLGKYHLYASFVRGGFLQGTIDEQQADASSTDPDEPTVDLKQASLLKETKEEKKARRADKRRREEERVKRREDHRERKLKASESRPNSEDARAEKRRRRADKEEKRRKLQVKEAKKARKREKEGS